MIEIEECRQVHSKRFKLDENKYRTVVHSNFIHVFEDFNDPESELVEIDHSPQQRGNCLSANKSWGRSWVPLHGEIGYAFRSRKHDQDVRVALLELDGRPIQYREPIVVPLGPPDHFEYHYIEVAPDLDIIVRMTPVEFSIWKKCKGEEAPKRFKWGVWRTRHVVTDGLFETGIRINFYSQGHDNGDLAEQSPRGSGTGA